MVLGSTTNAEHGGGPPGEHTHKARTASVYEWTDNYPPTHPHPPRQLQLTEEGGTQQVTKTKRKDKERESRQGEGAEEHNRTATTNAFYSS